jgi:nucleotide-binding universal stress UspA family protein
MSPASLPPVVVGIDGSRDGLIALAWSVRHARELRLPLRVVHVIDDERPASRPPTEEYDDGSPVVEEAADELERLGFSDATLEVRHGNPAMTLLDLAADARALVIGRRGMGGFAELILGSTSQVCTALSVGTLVVVPDQWQPDAPPRGRIVVGVDGSHDCQAALGFAFETADLRGAEVSVVHAVNLPETFPSNELWTDPDDEPWTTHAEAVVIESLAGWQEKYPEVAVRTSSTSGHPVQLLSRESAGADLVVVGGRGRTQFTPLRLGSVSRGLIHHAACPVAVIHHEEAIRNREAPSTEPGLTFET